VSRGPGVSVEKQDNGRWRVRWRETVEEPDGKRRREQRSKTVEDESTARQLAAKVLKALELGEVPQVEAVREIPRVASVDAVLQGWIRSRDAKGASAGTFKTYVSYSNTLLRTLRGMEGLPDGSVVPGTWLSREGVISLTAQLRADEFSESSVYWLVRALVHAWVWACDDAATYPGLVAAPRDLSSLLPHLPVRVAPPSPTLAECDAVLRRLSQHGGGTVALPASVIARCTGLRVAQVLSLTVGDVDVAHQRIRVRTGKTRREKVGRTIPMAPVLQGYLAELLGDRQELEAPLLPGQRREPSKTVARHWKAATLAGEVRKEVWAPAGRKTTRPDHAFRAAFQAHLVRKGVRDEVIDLLVGHAGGVREKHYVDEEARWEAAVDAVALLPPIDWQAPQDNVIRLGGR
jgi:integrase